MIKRKISKSTLICEVLTVILVIFSLTRVNKYYTPEVENFINYQVSYGDTIWGIAEKYNNTETDIRFVIDEICSKNKLKSDVITEGQVLLIPVFK